MELQKENKINQLKSTHNIIIEKLTKLSRLQSQYSIHFNKKYLQTIQDIMIKMQDNLQKAQFKVNNIDKEIKQDKNAVKLVKEKYFYEKQGNALEKELEQIYERTNNVKGENTKLEMQIFQLRSKLFQKSRSSLKYRCKVASLEKQYIEKSKEKAIDIINSVQREDEVEAAHLRKLTMRSKPSLSLKLKLTAKTQYKTPNLKNSVNAYDTDFNFYNNPQKQFQEFEKIANHYLYAPSLKSRRNSNTQKRQNFSLRKKINLSNISNPNEKRKSLLINDQKLIIKQY